MPSSSTAQTAPPREGSGNPELLSALAAPAMYRGHPEVSVHETHASWVFVAGNRAFKVKKPVSLGFLDYGTLAQRRGACREEVRVNRKLAPGLYLGVRAIVRGGPAGFRLARDGAPERGRVRRGDAQLQRAGHVRGPDRDGLSHPRACRRRGAPARGVPPLRGRGIRLGAGAGARRLARECRGAREDAPSPRMATGRPRGVRRGVRSGARARTAPSRALGARPRRPRGPALRARAGQADRRRGRPHRVRPAAAPHRRRLRSGVPGDGSRGPRAALGGARARRRLPSRGRQPRRGGAALLLRRPLGARARQGRTDRRGRARGGDRCGVRARGRGHDARAQARARARTRSSNRHSGCGG